LPRFKKRAGFADRVCLTLIWSCNESCPECKRLRDEYEHATTTQVELEGKLLSAVSKGDRDSIHSLNPKVETAWRLRAALRAAIRDHGSWHVNHPGGKLEL
jgi:hypothetical protein